MVSALREPEAEGLMRSGLARVVGKGSRVRCVMLSPGVSRRVAMTFLHGNRYGAPSRTVRVERVGDKRQPVYQHLDRSFGFGTLESLPIVTRPPEPKPDAIICTAQIIPDAALSEPEAEKGVGIIDTLGGQAECRDVPTESLQVIPSESERGFDAEREGEGVTDEPATPDDAVPPKQPEHIKEYYSENIIQPVTILEPEPYDITSERDLAIAVLLRAVEDSRTDPMARRWFEADDRDSRTVLEFWCQLAQLDPGRVRKRAREMIDRMKRHLLAGCLP